MSWRNWSEAVLDLLFPGSHPCVFCWQKVEGQKAGEVCTGCHEKIQEFERRLASCPRCGFFTPVAPCPNCTDWEDNLARVFSVVPYDGIYRDKIYGLKYNGEKELACPLGRLMARKVLRAGWGGYFDLVVPLPLHPLREEERGFNQSRLLARSVAGELGLPCEEKALLRQVYEKSQTLLGRSERRLNMRGTFTVQDAQRVRAKKVLLVDDIITTGATLQAAAAALRAAGAREVSGLTWAAGYDKNFR